MTKRKMNWSYVLVDGFLFFFLSSKEGLKRRIRPRTQRARVDNIKAGSQPKKMAGNMLLLSGKALFASSVFKG